MAVNCTLTRNLGAAATPCSARQCSHCGWNEAEDKRRKELPLVLNGYGLWCKDVTVKGGDADALHTEAASGEGR